MRLKTVKYKEIKKEYFRSPLAALLNKCAEEKARNWVGLSPERGLDT